MRVKRQQMAKIVAQKTGYSEKYVAKVIYVFHVGLNKLMLKKEPITLKGFFNIMLTKRNYVRRFWREINIKRYDVFKTKKRLCVICKQRKSYSFFNYKGVRERRGLVCGQCKKDMIKKLHQKRYKT